METECIFRVKKYQTVVDLKMHNTAYHSAGKISPVFG
ncbi:hypothetical protein P872_13345 [Rhodonellum psychrophilum GCM71 = DSM 17998]|uniref:Uncharacterized protein n=1 Tax=Rhodonellum psychrophilum GCM71 = DSM 17998 TaxID=1123057 RepID=U5BWI0_9BACT|nr:hypothetical protein P872_13345 [Rhodonellum psychrophilum GCM71 = DSM 17998]